MNDHCVSSSTTVMNCSLLRFLKWQLILSYCDHNFQYIKFQSGKQCLQNYHFNRGNNAVLISKWMNFSFSDQIVVSLLPHFILSKPNCYILITLELLACCLVQLKPVMSALF